LVYTVDWALQYEPAMIEQKGAQSGELLATAGPSRAAMKTTGHNVAVAGILTSNGRIHSQDSSMQIADPQKDFL
jgi:hypothetical protein